VIIIASAAIVVLAWASTRTRLTVDGVEAELAQWAVAGTPIAIVYQRLDSLGVERSTDEPGRREVLAIWRRTRRALFDESSIQVQFEFDDRGLLVRYEVRELITAM
jgi:hypothetical protein